MPDVHQNIFMVAGCALLVMLIGTVVRLTALGTSADTMARTRRESLLSWWLVALAVLLTAVLGRGFGVLLFVAVSLLALHEFSVLYRDAIPRPLAWICRVLIAASYLCILLNLPRWFIMLLPAAGLLGLSAGGLFTRGPNRDRLLRTVLSYRGLLLTGYVPAFAILLMTLPAEANPVAGGAGFFLFLMLLTEANDIVQALVGRRFGKRQLAPRISPHKTWAGFAGGALCTVGLAGGLSPWLTPYEPLTAMLLGLIISITGVLGDLNMSAMKRERHVKDSGRLLPGQGGMLDRIDSLTFTAPVFYAAVTLLHMTPATQTS